MLLVPCLQPWHSPGQLGTNQRLARFIPGGDEGGLFNKKQFLGFGGASLPESVFTHLKLTDFLLSVHIVHHHELTIDRSLRAVGAFSLLCYRGLEGDVCLERTVVSQPGLGPPPSPGEELTAAPSRAHRWRSRAILHPGSIGGLVVDGRDGAKACEGASNSLRCCWPGFSPS